MGVQAVTTELSRIQGARIDCLSLSSHKFHAPRGVGILACRQRVDLVPLVTGASGAGTRSGPRTWPPLELPRPYVWPKVNKLQTPFATAKTYRQQLAQALEAQGWVVFAQNRPHPTFFVPLFQVFLVGSYSMPSRLKSMSQPLVLVPVELNRPS